MLKWFYKEKNSARILFAVATWLFVYVGIAFVGLLGAANGFNTMTPEELENPTLEMSLIALVMLLIMGVSCLPGIFFTVHAVKAYKADKEAILPRPPHEIRAEMDQLNERSQKLRAEIKAQVFITNIDSNAYDGKKVRAINKEIRYITRRYKELEKEVEKGIRMGSSAPKTTAEASPAAEAIPSPDPVPPSPSEPSINIATEPAPAYQPAAPIDTITVIDFEIANNAYDSACAIGIVVLKDGAILEREHFYIQPPGNKYYSSNIAIHGITPELTKTTELFPDVWEKIKSYFQDTYVTAHNASFDMSVLKTVLNTYGLDQPQFLYFDTLHLLDRFLSHGERRNLDALCEKFNITIENRHDALGDATAAANLILYDYKARQPKSFTEYFNCLHFSDFGTVTVKKTVSFVKPPMHESARSITASTAVNAEKDADFDGKTFLFTGEMEQLSREEAMQEVVKRGGTVKDGISQKIDVLVNANPSGKTTSKVRRALELQEEGHRIKIIDEETFLKMLADNDAIDI